VTAIVAIVAAVIVLADADRTDVADGTPVTNPVTGDLDVTASLTGVTVSITGGLASPLPGAIEFGDDGTFRVLDPQGVTLDDGIYRIADDVITFVSEAPAPLWHRNPLMGAADPSASIRENLSCEGVGGDYRVVPGEANQLVLEVVWDECPSRLTVARGLQFRLGA
jgi:hypothetical protein